MKKKIKFKNYILNKNKLKHIISEAFTNYGIRCTSSLADEMKELGFHYATKAGISISLEDLKISPTKKNLLLNSEREISNSDLRYRRGEITSVERFQKIIDTWNKTSDTLKNHLVKFFREKDTLNSIYLMAFSGARGNISQVRQLVGMRGLMADPNGQIMDIPIIHNFREGLTITDYLMSAYGARKGVVDTSLRTADSGYLTRRLVDVVQDVVIREIDCFTMRSLCIFKKNDDIKFRKKIFGRTSAENLYSKEKLIIKKNEIITSQIIDEIFNQKLEYIRINSPLTCESLRSICQKCYGSNLASGNIINLGETVGIIAAQSIGEPGTQLTMRTFHTGGIFTSDPNRQILALKTGIFYFDLDNEIKIIRTSYGNNVYFLEKDKKCFIIDYRNSKIEITLPASSNLFVKNKSFIKEGDLIAELFLKNKQTKKTKKNIVASHSGELIFNKKSEIIWILEGDVYRLPKNVLFNKYDLEKKIKINDNFVYFKLPAEKPGIVSIIRDKISKTTEIIKISEILGLLDWQFLLDKKSKEFIFRISPYEYVIKQKLSSNFLTPFIFSNKISDRFKTEMGGIIIYPKKSFVKYNFRLNREIIVKNGKILYVPIEVHVINRSNSLVLIENNTIITESFTMLFSNYIYTEINGFLEIKEHDNFVDEITIKPGQLFEYFNLKRNSIKSLWKLHKKIFFPGDIIFGDIIVEYLTLIEIKKVRQFHYLMLRPIQEYNIPKPKTLLKDKSNFNNILSFKHINILNFQSLYNSKQSTSLIQSLIDIKTNKKEYNLIYHRICSNQNKIYLSLIIEKIINIWDLLLNKFNKINKFNLSLAIDDFEYIDQESILGFISIIPQTIGQITQIKKQKFKTLITKNENFKQLYIEHNFKNINKNSIIRVGDKISSKLNFNFSGQIVLKSSFKINVHKITPFFVTQNTRVTKKNGDLIEQNEFLGTISFEQMVTRDIIQGLPKVEEILEARVPQIPLNFFDNFGFINNNGYLFQNNFLSNDNKIINFSFGQYFYIGKLSEKLTEGSINPHKLLETYFNYYKYYDNQYEAAYLSFKNLQILLIEKVQQVYNLQDVYISDKHLETILKKITSKVIIENSGSSSFLKYELIELKTMGYINDILEKTSKIKVLYKPILLGITKASLISESFLSAASFQETIKILTASAIIGKKDWFNGLKENILIGRLIPAGTGFSTLS